MIFNKKFKNGNVVFIFKTAFGAFDFTIIKKGEYVVASHGNYSKKEAVNEANIQLKQYRLKAEDFVVIDVK